MGALVSIIRQIGDSGYEDISEDFKLFIDFEGGDDLLSSPEERELCDEISDVIKNSHELLRFVRDYGAGGTQAIFEATSNPGNQQKQDDAWDLIVPMTRNLIECKTMSDNMSKLVPKILGQLWQSGEEQVLTTFSKYPCLVLQFGKILDITMRFDDLKMAAPSVQNDISYVKRQITVKKLKGSLDDSSDINTQAMNELAMFYIHPSPMMKKIIDSVTEFFSKLTPSANSKPVDVIVSFAKVCIKILDSDMRQKFQKPATIHMVERILTALTLLYDHLSPTGVFVKESPIDIRYVVDILDQDRACKPRGRKGSMLGGRAKKAKRCSTMPVEFVSQRSLPAGEGSDRTRLGDLKKDDRKSKSEDDLLSMQRDRKNLLNVLKYSNRHLRDTSTPKSVESLFNKLI